MNNLRASVVLVLLAVLLVAWMFRFEPMPSTGSIPMVWDRWHHRICAVWAGGHFNCFDTRQDQ
ncbi:hypothetical protein R69919_05090 [Paraburkholderia gardini]|nr:hypothetical protein R69919_05090 [Paraburkholderia gardini]